MPQRLLRRGGLLHVRLHRWVPDLRGPGRRRNVPRARCRSTTAPGNRLPGRRPRHLRARRDLRRRRRLSPLPAGDDLRLGGLREWGGDRGRRLRRAGQLPARSHARLRPLRLRFGDGSMQGLVRKRRRLLGRATLSQRGLRQPVARVVRRERTVCVGILRRRCLLQHGVRGIVRLLRAPRSRGNLFADTGGGAGSTRPLCRPGRTQLRA